MMSYKKAPLEVVPGDLSEKGKAVHALMKECVESKDFSKIKAIFNMEGDPVEAWARFDGIPKEWEGWLRYTVEVDGKGYQMIGRSDTVMDDGEWVSIVDTKTANRAYITAQAEKQLSLYAYPYLLAGKKVRTFVFFPSQSAMKEAGEYHTIDDLPAISDYIESEVRRVETAIKTNGYPSACSFCAFCNWSISCPRKPSSLVDSPEKAVEMALEYVKAEAHLNALTRALEGWAQEKGQIRIEGGSLGFQPSKTTRVDEKRLSAYIEAGKINKDDVLVVSASKVKAVATKNADVADVIYQEAGDGRFYVKWDKKPAKKKEVKEDGEGE